MKTFKNLLSVLFVMSFTLSAYSAIVVPASPATESSAEFQGQLVKATFVNGEWIPVVELPEVEIIGSKYIMTVHKGVVHHGEVIAEVELPTVEITGLRNRNSSEITADESSYERIYDLPIIEIESTFPLNNLTAAKHNSTNYLAVVDLDEVTISFDGNEGKHNADPYGMSISTEAGNNYLVASTVNPEILKSLSRDLREDNTYKYYSIAVKNCIIKENRQKLCELVVKMSNSAVEGLKENLINVMTN